MKNQTCINWKWYSFSRIFLKSMKLRRKIFKLSCHLSRITISSSGFLCERAVNTRCPCRCWAIDITIGIASLNPPPVLSSVQRAFLARQHQHQHQHHNWSHPLSLYASYNSHSALRITKYLRAYWQWKTLMKCAHSLYSRVRRQWNTFISQDYAYASLISQCKQNAMRCQICKILWRIVHPKMC